ncbi:lisH domain-containing protein ARMC9 isoform X2 [Dermacentor silvarum]|uniref:lisH domain-containing protein ARMC9 isoform X2 n=1 Tax=Dermacentor silvarum TaxID=543639 RepID=UPI002101A9DE|nr:lisH domain-containing protein ARMC9 isoform X2 [Dermacentor silvarum]
MSGFVLSIEGELNFIVKEYLDYLGLHSVSKHFEEECLARSKPIQESFASYRNERTQKVQKELLSYFDEGKQAQFFAIWDSVVSRSTAIAETMCHDLEFHLRLHFAVYPLRYPEKANLQGSMTVEGAMSNFRQYIESIKARTEDPLVYFALPYVQNPRQFPVFKPVFEESWVNELKTRLEKFVQESLSTQYQQRAKPRLMDLYYCSDVELNDMREDFRRCEQRLQQCDEQRAALDKQMSELQDDYKTLVSVTTELITALEATVRGDMVNLENVLFSCGQRFPELVKLQTPRTSCGSSTCDGTQVFVLRSGLHTRRTRLDFSKIKQDLSEASASTRALLLQALRWKLTKASSVEERDCVLLAYVDNDLLGFFERSPDYCNRILHIIKSPNSGLQQSFVRFLNTLAAFRSGRNYLAKNLQLVAVLTDTLVFDRVTNPRTLDMILGILQKLSLRRQQKDIMITHGILEWVVRTLQESEEVGLSEYGLEYITALFMNLCLQKSAKQHCRKMSTSVIDIVKKLLEHKNAEIVPYLNGALYSLLCDTEFRSIAVQMGLEASLQKAKLLSSPDVRHQVDQVCERLLSSDANVDDGIVDSLSEDDEDDEDSQEESEPEPELDMDDIVQALPHQMYGDQLLKVFYEEENQDTVSQRALTVSSRLEESSPDQSLEETTVNAPETSQSDEIDCSQATHTEAVEFTAPPVDEQASELVKQLTGEEKTVVAAAGQTAPPSDKVNGLNMQEYSIAFSSRPKIPRTPEPSVGGTSSRVDSTPTSSQSLRRSPASTSSRGNTSSVRPAHSTEQE